MNAGADALEAVAAVADRLAVLLGAGVAPQLAWRHLADAAGDGGALDARALRAAADAAADGADVGVAIADALAA
ncbi:pilus assembly protein, partial [Agromyces sp. MMS17-SY077]|nr:pilus assembly protein [Agromyces seonyuensis]